MGIRCLLSMGIRCLLSKVRGSWEKTLYPVGTKFAGCDGGPNRNLGLPAGWGSGKHIEGGPGQGKLTGQKDWLASPASMGTKSGQSKEVPHDEVRSRGCVSMGVKARVAP